MLDQSLGCILKREWPLVLAIGPVKNIYNSRTSTFLSVTIGAMLHLDFNIVQGRNPTPGLWWNSRGFPSIAKKWAQPPSWCFPLKQSVQYCLGPVLSGVVTYHHPNLSIPCPRAVSLLSPGSEHTQGFQRMGSVASPTCTHSFPCAAPVLEAFLREKETGRAEGRDTCDRWTHVTAALCCARGRRGCRSLVQSSSPTKCWWYLPFCRLQKDLDVSTIHLLQPNAGGFLCRQVGGRLWLLLWNVNQAF